MTRPTWTLVCLLLVPLGASVHADPAPTGAQRAGATREKLAQRFAQADTNRDGRISLAEARAGMPMIAQHFDEIDRAHAGVVSADQILEYMRARMAQTRVDAAK